MRTILGAALFLNSFVVVAQNCRPLQEYDEITSIVTEQFYDKTYNGLDWDARISSYRDEIDCDDSAEGIAAVVNGLLSELNASHTELFTSADLHYWGLNSFFGQFDSLDSYQIDFSGIWPERKNDKWYARFVLEGSPADQSGVLVGDELIALDGSDFQPLGFGESPSTLTVSSDGRATRDVQIEPIKQSLSRGFLDASSASAEVLSIGGKRVGFFHLWAGGDAMLGRMNAVLSDFEAQRVDALVLDLRGGYGGMGENFIAKIRDSAHLSEIPKYFLIDDSCRSGKELVAGLIKKDGLGTLVGSTTAGHYLGGRANRLFDDKYFLYVAVGGGSHPGIGKIEGVGIEPDVYVSPCRSYCSGIDPEFEKAIELIRD